MTPREPAAEDRPDDGDDADRGPVDDDAAASRPAPKARPPQAPNLRREEVAEADPDEDAAEEDAAEGTPEEETTDDDQDHTEEDIEDRPRRTRGLLGALDARIGRLVGRKARSAPAAGPSEEKGTPVLDAARDRAVRAWARTKHAVIGEEGRTIPYDPHDPPRPPWLGGRHRILGVRFADLAKWTTVALVVLGLGAWLFGFVQKLSLDDRLFVDITTWDADITYAIGLLLLLFASTLRRYAPRKTTEERQAAGLERFILNRRVQSTASLALVGLISLAILVDALAFLNAVGVLPGTTVGTLRLALAITHHGAILTTLLLAAILLHALLIDFHDEETRGRLRLAWLLRGAVLVLVLVGAAVNRRALLGVADILHPINAVVLYATALTLLAVTLFVQGGIESPARPMRALLRRFEDVRHLTVDWTIITALVLGGASLVVVGVLVTQDTGPAQEPVPVLYSVVFLGAVLVALLFVFFRLIRLGEIQKEQIARRRYRREEVVRLTLIVVSATLSVLFVFLGVLDNAGIVGPLAIGGFTLGTADYMAFTAFAAIGPMSFYAYAQKRRIRAMEDRFPELLRDLAESRRAGLTLVSALRSASYGDYGPLTPEIHTMARQLSWGVPFERVLALFADRIHTPLVDRSVSLILEAGKAGGRVTDVLLAAARDAREIRLLGRDRRLQMSTYIMIVYVAALVFLAVVAIMANMFVPRIVEAGATIEEIGQSAGFSGSVLPLEEYIFFYFGAAIIQSLGSGLVAGTLEDGQVVSGFRHAFLLMLVSYVTFRIIVL